MPLPKNENGTMTRDEMQSAAMIIEKLLSTVEAMFGDPDFESTLFMIELAAKKSRALNNALDTVNAQEAAL